MSDPITKSWFMEFEPKSIDDLVFNSDQDKSRAQKWIDDERIDGNVLNYGPPGLGKTALSRILISHLIKAQNDLFIASERSVKEVREQIKPFVNKAPIKSKCKIVYIEEFDKLHPDALNELKTNLMERFQDQCIFLCNTNYIQKIANKDNAILSRFTYKLEFSGKNTEGFTNRLANILDQKNAEYDHSELTTFVENNVAMGVGMRELINTLQNSYISNNGVIDFASISHEGGIEQKIVGLILEMLTVLIQSDPKNKKLCVNNPNNSSISTQYKQFVSLIHNNWDINYNVIYDRLYQQMTYIPAKMICGKFEDQHDFKKHPQLNILGCFYELMICIGKINRF